MTIPERLLIFNVKVEGGGKMSMMNNFDQQIERARGIFSKMPQPLFDMYIKNLIVDIKSWPFQTSLDSVYGTNWERIFM